MKIARPMLIAMLAVLLAFLSALAADTNVERDYEIALTKGQYAIELQDFPVAIGHLKKALALKPKDQAARVSLGVAYSRSGDQAAARDVLQQAVAADATDARARYELALVLARLGQTGEAKAQMAQATKSGDPEVRAAAQSYLEGAGGEKKKFTTKLSGGLQADSNVILEPDAPYGKQTDKTLDPKESVSFEEVLMATVYQQEAMLNILERKGLLSRKEVLEEIVRIRKAQKTD